jgi:hypothetical protein
MLISSDSTLSVEQIPGGYTVTDANYPKHWWSVAYRGATPTIASYLCENVDPHSHIGRRILSAIRASAVIR